MALLAFWADISTTGVAWTSINTITCRKKYTVLLISCIVYVRRRLFLKTWKISSQLVHPLLSCGSATNPDTSDVARAISRAALVEG